MAENDDVHQEALMSIDRRQFLQEAGIAAVATAATTSTVAAETLSPEHAEPASNKAPKAPVAKQIKVSSVQSTIEAETTAKMRKRLGLKDSDPIPNDVASLITEQSATAAASAVQLGATRDAQEAARDFGRKVSLDDFQAKLAAARTGIQVIGKSQDVEAILKERATMLWKKRQALEAAGFSGADAMQILLADIAARPQ